MNRIPACVLVIIFTLPPSLAWSATLAGRVVGVHDGDSITVLDASKTQHKIRLARIDAPELKQAFGTRSKQNLSKLVYDQLVAVEWEKLDRYGRTIGVVYLGGQDVNLEQIRAGMAWWYWQYSDDQAVSDREMYEQAEIEARVAKRGLWVDSDRVPPWEWRKNQMTNRRK